VSRKEQKPDFSNAPRFPVRRLLVILIQGNMMFLGGVYCLAISGEVLDYFKYNSSYADISEVPLEVLGTVVSGTFEYLGFGDEGIDFLVGSLLVCFGSFASIVWYVIARQIETRHAKKRWLIYVKSRGSEFG